MTARRVFTAALASETNTFAPIPTERRHFDEWFCYAAGEHPGDGPTLFTAPLWHARARAKELGWDVFEGLCAAAFPSGRVVRETYEQLRDELLADLKAVLPVNIVLLGLHGSLAADGYDDCEGDILSRVREIVGPEAVVGVELDPHCHLTREMVTSCDLLLAFQEYPHTDAGSRGALLVDLAASTDRGEIDPVIAVADARMSAQFFTQDGPAAKLVEDMRALEQSGTVLAASLGHSFASGDVADMTVAAFVMTDGDAVQACAIAEQLRDHAFAIRETASTPRIAIEPAIAAVAANDTDKPVILAEGSDNPGGGAPGDATTVIHALLKADCGPVAVGPIWDPQLAQIAIARGKGARFDARVGGKASVLSGLPLDLAVEVLEITRNAVQDFGGSTWPMGDMVGLKAGRLELAICTVRNQAFTPEIFEQTGIDVSSKRALLLKSNHHFAQGFGPVASRIIYLDSPGVAVSDPRRANYVNVRRPLWPLDDAEAARAAQTSFIRTRS